MNPLSNDELISAYLDGELSSEEQQRAERLLADDAESRQLLEELRSLRAGIESLPRHQLDGEFDGEFASRVLDQAERSMIAGEFAASDAATDTEGHESEKATFVSTPLEPTDHGLAERGMSRDRLIRMIAWPAIAIAAAVMIMVIMPPESKDLAMHEPAVPAEPATSAEVADETVPKIAGKMSVAAGTSPTETRSRDRDAFEVAEDGDPFGDQGDENPLDGKVKSPSASQVKSPEFADHIAAKPPAGLGGPPLSLPTFGLRRKESASSSDGLGNELDRLLEPDSRLKKSLSRDSSRDASIRRIDAVAVLNVAMPVGREKETSLRSVWSRHQLVAMALPARKGRELAEKTKESPARFGRGPGAPRAKKSASVGKSKKQAMETPDRVFVFVVEGTEAQVRAALAELSDQSGGYRFRYGSVELAENEPALDDVDIAADSDKDDFDAADFLPAAGEAQKADAPAPEAEEEPKSESDIDGEGEADGGLAKGGRANTDGPVTIGGKERRIRVMVVFRTATEEADSTPAAVPAENGDE